MKQWLAFVMLICLQGALVAAGPQGGTQPVSLLPLSRWEVRTAAGDEAALSEQGGALALRFRVNVAHTFLIGHVTYWRGYADLLLKEPIAIPAASGLERIRAEASGITSGHEKTPTKVMLLPILRDRDGELFYYVTSPSGHLLAGGKGWSQWQTASFYAGEAGAATQDLYYAEGKLVNTWPDGDLTFLGFRMEIRESAIRSGGAISEKPATGPDRSGLVQIAAAELCPLVFAQSDPFLFCDSVLSKKGEYRFSAQIRNEFQGAPVREFSQAVSFDPDDAQSARQRLVFPLGPDDNYWIRYRITGQDDATVRGGDLRSQVQGKTQAAALGQVDPTTVPSTGCLRINESHPGRGVYGRDEPFAVSVRVFPGGRSAPELSWRLTPVMNSDRIASGNEIVPVADKPYSDLVLRLPAQPGRDAYRLSVVFRADGKELDAQTYLLGFKTDLAQRHDRAGDLTDRKKIHAHSYFRTSYVPVKRTPQMQPTEEEELQSFSKYVENAGRIGNALTYMVDLKDFEVLPGVFDFVLLDRILDAAADGGCKVNIRIGHADEHGNNLYSWQKYFRQINYDGAEAGGHSYYGAYAVTDERVTRFWLDSYRALHRRYQSHTAFQGYYVMLPGGEWTVVDQPWAGMCTGYDPAAAATFRQWLRESQHLTLEQLNQRWATAYRNWDEIQLPLPDFRAGSMPDLRMAWIDFCRFKSIMSRDIWFPLAVKSIRSYDSRNLITIYSPPKNARSLYGLLDYCHNGGNHYGQDLGEYVKDWEKGGIGWITEPHHPHRWAAYGDPAQKGWVLDWSVWVMLAQAGGGGANLHVYFMPNPTLDLAKHYGGGYAFDRLELFRPILEEMQSLRLEEPLRQVATVSDEFTLYCKHRTTFGSRLQDLRRWFELLKTDSVFSETYDPEHAGQYKLLVPNILDESMSAESLRLIEQGVKNGAKAVISANTGNYVPELGKEPFALLRALGIGAPQSEYRLNASGAEIIATAVDSGVPGMSALLPAGKLAFFTLARLKEDLASDAVKTDFWRYPYRWIPQTNYFGIYPGVRADGGVVLARFADGGAALSLHKYGKGEVLVFWGTPDMSGGRLEGFMAGVAAWAGVVNPRAGSPIPNTIEGKSDSLDRRYALLYQETSGAYQQKLLSIPDGRYFLDDLVSGQKLGVYEGRELREQGLKLEFVTGYSPLKIIRMMPLAQVHAEWINKYHVPNN